MRSTVKKTFEAAALADAHLIVQLKDNQPTLCQKVEALCEAAAPSSSVKTVDRNKRNRHETRTIRVFDATAAVVETEWESHVAAIIQVERDVIVRQAATGLWKRSLETSVYLSNRSVTAKIAADAIRNHWGIENRSHYTRDVTFREDASRIRTNPGIFARLRTISYNVLRCNQSETMPQDRFAAALGGLGAVLAMVFTRER
jgi:predicted transposase YbfD/YdcC